MQFIKLSRSETALAAVLALSMISAGCSSLAARTKYAALQQAIELSPERVDLRLNRGQIYLAGRDFKKADEDASFVIDREPDNALAYQLRGAALLGQKRYGSAAEAFTKLIELRPKDASPHVNLALVEAASGRYSQAEQELRKALETDPHCIQAALDLASLYRIMRRPQQAELNLKQAIEQNPDTTTLYVSWADTLYAQQNLEAMEAALSMLRQRKPNSGEAAIALGDFYSKVKQPDKAVTEYQRGLAIDHDN